jgi:hypothetical protein
VCMRFGGCLVIVARGRVLVWMHGDGEQNETSLKGDVTKTRKRNRMDVFSVVVVVFCFCFLFALPISLRPL